MTDAQEPAAPEAPEAEAIEAIDAVDAVDETVVKAEAADEPEEEKPVEGEIVDEEFTVHATDSAHAEEAPNQAAAQGTTDDAHQHGLGAELAALRTELDERTRDLQRVTAEYANYRKRVDRDRALVVEQASANVLGALLPVLDDLDRARDHGDLVGPFGAVADSLIAELTKFGLTVFGAKGDPFDPTRHEAVAHLTSAEVSEPTCIDVMRRGYLLGERLLRPALVAVADPE
ncbi:nucleotide exchange factor GrpE [Dactylosporangium sp. NPDC048998]|uniref:nucleotide exchange factor GrpE n=1 Tax=Dactylosporangium sp. NPDC048998 TaxID=3363976 RepID=UPI00371B422B